MNHSRIGQDITGRRFGTLVAIQLIDERSKHKQKQWLCNCDCGKETIILQNSLVTGNTTRCNDHPKNNYTIDENTVKLDVSTNSMPNAICFLDKEDLERVLNYKTSNGRLRWIAHNSNTEGHDRWGIYVFATDRKTKLHRFVLNLRDPMLIVDHINGDTLDNRKCNLRVITRSENNKNMRKRVNNTSGATGVSYNKRRDNYEASIQLHGKKFHLGTFNSLELANCAYNAAAKVLGFSERHGK